MQSCWGKFQSEFPQWQWLLLFPYQWGKLDLRNVWSGTFNTPQSKQPRLHGKWALSKTPFNFSISSCKILRAVQNQITSKRTGRQSKNNLSYQDRKTRIIKWSAGYSHSASMPISLHFLRRHSWHFLLMYMSISQFPPLLHLYTAFLVILRLKKPGQKTGHNPEP